MKSNSISFGYSTEKLLEISLPQMTDIRKSDLIGVGINIDVDDVKKEYEDMLNKGAEIDLPLKEHEWGEIAFSIKDPNDLMIYVCKSIESNCIYY